MEAVPVQAYLVCATPRSGSTLLCEMLLATGRAGRPLEHFELLTHTSLPRQPLEYFDGIVAPEVLSCLAPLETGNPHATPPAAWWSGILADGVTDNGIWSGKLMWGQVEDFMSRARHLAGLHEAGLATVLRTLLGDLVLVHVTREDRIAQAVSLWRAVQTQAWRAENTRSADTERYEFAAIDHLVSQLEAHDDAWRDWFATSGFDPIPVTYDELDAEPRQTVIRVLRALGISDDDVPVPPLHRQRDERSLAWIERYRHEQAQAA